MKKRARLVTTFALLFGLPLAVFGQIGHLPGLGELVDPIALVRYLDLDESQVDEAIALLMSTREAVGPIQQSIREKEAQLAELLAGDDPSASEVGDLVIAVHADRQAIRSLHEAYDADFVALLDGDQEALYSQMKDVLRVVRWSLSHDGPPPPPPGEGGSNPSP